MPVLNLTVDDLLGLFQRLMPRGAVWTRSAGATQTRAIRALMPTYRDLVLRDNNLLVDAFPATAYELLPEWEATLGLPDPCAGESPTLQLRRRQVVARLVGGGGQSPAYYVARAADLGYQVSVQEYAPARMGSMRMGARMNGAEWAHVWAVRAPLVTVSSFRFGQGTFGERYRVWGNDVLECELRSVAPAHTILLFQYI